MSEYKICKKCSSEKLLIDFPNRKGCINNIGPVCKACVSDLRITKYRQNHPLLCQGMTKNPGKHTLKFIYPEIDSDILRRFYTYTSAAKKRNIPFDLSINDFCSFWNKNCFYCEKIIDGIGIDRIDNSLGYTRTNIVSCCFYCNTMKLDLDIDDFYDRCRTIIKVLKSKLYQLICREPSPLALNRYNPKDNKCD